MSLIFIQVQIAAQNHIADGSFEISSGPPNGAHDTEKLLYWDADEGDFNNAGGESLRGHSPDFYQNGVSVSGTFAPTLTGAYFGQNYIGMAGYEMIHSNLLMTPTEGEWYHLSLQIQVSTQFPSSWNGTNSNLRIYLSNEPFEYKGGGVELCDSDYRSFKEGLLSGLFRDIVEIASFTLDISNYPSGEWHELSSFIYIPYGGPDLDNLAIQVTEEFSGSTPDIGCSQDFVFIDNIVLQPADFCDSECAPADNDDQILFSANQIGGTAFTPENVQNSMVAWGTPINFLIKNALGVEFVVFNQWGAEVYRSLNYNNGVLKDIGYQDFLWYWNGDIDGNAGGLNSLPEGQYAYNLKVWNCAEEWQWIGQQLIYLVNGSGTPGFNDDIEQFTDLRNCCPNQIVYHDEVLSDEEVTFVSAGESIEFGLVSPLNDVIIYDEANYIFQSGESITFRPNFTAEIGASCNFIIGSCESGNPGFVAGRVRPDITGWSEIVKSSSLTELDGKPSEYFQLKIYPNPIKNESFNISINSNKIAAGIVSVYDMSGALVDEIRMNSYFLSVEVSDWNSGVYNVVFQSDDGNTVSVDRVVVL